MPEGLKCVFVVRKAQDNTSEGHEEGTVSWQKVTLILELLQHKKKLKRAQMLVPVLFSLLSRYLHSSSPSPPVWQKLT